jgi:signal transduction histidine kinase
VPDGVDVFKLFETTKTEGTGIGLAVAKQIVAAHGGVIEYLTRSPRGTIFQIELPLGGPTTRIPDGPLT